jgi:PEP-CTERM motif
MHFLHWRRVAIVSGCVFSSLELLVVRLGQIFWREGEALFCVSRESARGVFMKRRFSISALLSAAVVGVLGAGAQAGTVPGITFFDGNPLYVQSVVGSGPDVAYLSIDLASGTKVSWQYDFDNSSAPVDGWQMLTDIAAADPNLLVNATFFPSFSEHLVNNFQYGAVAGVPSKWDFATGTYSSSNVSSTNPQGTTWVFPSVGIDQEDLSNDELIGWVDMTRPTPSPVMSESLAAVPEPASVSMLLMGTGLLIRRRRR